MPGGYGIPFIACLDLHFLCSFFLKVIFVHSYISSILI